MKDDEIFEGSRLSFIADQERKFLCKSCTHNQPERSKREDINYYGMKAEINNDGLCYFEDGRIIDPSQMIDDAVL